MASSSSSALSAISSYTDSQAKKKTKNGTLGRDDFLTVLVAQLQHQDPLNPMDSQDFTAQLAQFSQLEAQFNTNETLDKIANSLEQQGGKNAESYLGKEVTASVDTIDLADGKAVGGFYTIKDAADITVSIYDDSGKEVKTLSVGQKDAGTYPIEWDGKDKDGSVVSDGAYKYAVKALTASGYAPVTTTISGKVDSLFYQGDKTFLMVNGVLAGADSVIEMKADSISSTADQSAYIDYLGKNVTADKGLIQVKDGAVKNTLPSFIPEGDDTGRVNILNSRGEIVYSYFDGNLVKGNSKNIEWDGNNLEGNKAPDGYYSYEVITGKNTGVDTSVKGEVTGVYYNNTVPYLNVNGVMVALGDISSVDN